ncbi:AmmeMemoRadiSam system protein B [Candidatus Omnitrophota bacterium]
MRKIIMSISLSALMASFSFAQSATKDADLAGAWYPGTKGALSAELAGYFKAAEPEEIKGDILAVISPHAGTRFSGPVAAYAFKAVRGRDYKTVIVIGFTHRKYFNGVSVYDKGSFRTPLGEVRIDEALAKDIIAQNHRISVYDQLFREENSVELLIPFVQYALPDAKIVPIAFGTQNYPDTMILANALANVMRGRKDVLIAASTDMSHFHTYDEANVIDKNAMSILKAMKAKDLYNKGKQGVCELCGLLPVTTTLLLAERLGYHNIEILKYANSGDTSGNKDRVVGYLSAAIYKNGKPSPVKVKAAPPVKIEAAPRKVTEDPFKVKEEPAKVKEAPPVVKKAPAKVKKTPKAKVQRIKKDEAKMPERILNDTQRERLLKIARESITSYVRDGKKKEFSESDPVLNEEMGAFVTLHKNGQLRGCIGNMVGRGPLYQTVANMAIEAATGDPRFPRLSPGEIDDIDIEVSALSPLKKVKSAKEIQIPGHGVIVKRGFRSGVYLPQVATETGWSKEQFLTSLCGSKAGIDPEAWKDPQTEMLVFSAEVFGEKD